MQDTNLVSLLYELPFRDAPGGPICPAYIQIFEKHLKLIKQTNKQL